MDIYAIGDLHLQGGADKPMNVFGPQWEGHFDRIRRDWRDKVRESDVVLLPGDISWAMQTEDAVDADTFMIPNTPGVALPATGGVGTKFHYIFGAAMILLAGALLLLKRKRDDKAA